MNDIINIKPVWDNVEVGFFRHFKLKMKIIWAVLTDSYTNSDRHQCWWLWGDNTILISFDKGTYDGRSCGFNNYCTCKWRKKSK